MKKVKKSIGKKIGQFFLLGLAVYITAGFLSTIQIKNSYTNQKPDTILLKLSEDILYNVKTETETKDLELKLANYDMQQVIAGLKSDEAIKTFWINIYNAWYQILAVRDKQTRPEIFTDKRIPIAGTTFSLDDIEHGILRKYRWKYGMGYFPKFFPGKLIKQLAVAEIDYRIHFTLNCGAKSCPPIAFYTYEKINQQLDIATHSFLEPETEIDDAKKEIRVSKIMDWFRGDFNGKNGIKKIISSVLQRDVSNYTVKFNDYNWDAELHNFNGDR